MPQVKRLLGREMHRSPIGSRNIATTSFLKPSGRMKSG